MTLKEFKEHLRKIPRGYNDMEIFVDGYRNRRVVYHGRLTPPYTVDHDKVCFIANEDVFIKED